MLVDVPIYFVFPAGLFSRLVSSQLACNIHMWSDFHAERDRAARGDR